MQTSGAHLKNISVGILSMLLIFLAANSNAQLASKAPVIYRTYGVPDCGEWFGSSRNFHKYWLAGYLTGLNMKFQSNPLGRLNSMDQADLWIDNYCKANPLKSVAEGGDDLLTGIERNIQKP